MAMSEAEFILKNAPKYVSVILSNPSLYEKAEKIHKDNLYRLRSSEYPFMTEYDKDEFDHVCEMAYTYARTMYSYIKKRQHL